MDALRSVTESQAEMRATEAQRDSARSDELRARRERLEERREADRSSEPGRGEQVDRYA